MGWVVKCQENFAFWLIEGASSVWRGGVSSQHCKTQHEFVTALGKLKITSNGVKSWGQALHELITCSVIDANWESLTGCIISYPTRQKFPHSERLTGNQREEIFHGQQLASLKEKDAGLF